MTARRVLLDENLDVRLRRWLPGVTATSVEFMGWKGIRNGELIRRAKAEGFDVLVTADHALAREPRLWAPLACVFLTANQAKRLRVAGVRIEAACREVLPGQVLTVDV